MIDAGAGRAGRRVSARVAGAAVALARCAVRAVAVNAVAVVVAPFLVACSEPAGGEARGSAARYADAGRQTRPAIRDAHVLQFRDEVWEAGRPARERTNVDRRRRKATYTSATR